MTKQDIQEDLVKLFLRLNGYFTTGLIIHSSSLGKNQTELDTVAVRFPFHNQPERLIGCSEYLQIPKGSTDIVIGEVKSGGAKIQFNEALRNDRTSLEKLINWLGAFDKDEVDLIIDILQNLLKPKQINTPDHFHSISFDGNQVVIQYVQSYFQ
jgi:hypothetical protein